MSDPASILADLDARIARIARRVARLPGDIGDVEQAARVAVWEAAVEFGDTVGDGFLVQRAKWAAQNEAARLARQRHDARPLDGLEHTLAEQPPDESSVDDGAVRSAVAHLPVRHRSVIEARFFDPAAMHDRSAGFQTNTRGLSRRNAAKKLRLTASQVRTAEGQALDRLRVMLERTGYAA